MAQNKTTENEDSVTDFINGVADERKRADSFKIVELMEQESGFSAKMWGPAIVGFGSYHYKYDSGREGDMPIVGFSPRANAITFYLANGAPGFDALLAKLGKHTTSKACIYVKKLVDIDMDVLREMVREGVAYTIGKYK